MDSTPMVGLLFRFAAVIPTTRPLGLGYAWVARRPRPPGSAADVRLRTGFGHLLLTVPEDRPTAPGSMPGQGLSGSSASLTLPTSPAWVPRAVERGLPWEPS